MNFELLPPEGVPDWAWAKIAKVSGTRWAIDERNASGEVIGTAYRLPDGSKDFKAGGKRGLVVAWPLDSYAGSSPNDPIFVCEGASDTAALLGLHLQAVGIPAAGLCGTMLAELLDGRDVVIVSDPDQAGRTGTAKIEQILLARCASVRTIFPPNNAKDARAAVIGGADAATFANLADAAENVKPAFVPVNGAPALVNLADVQAQDVRWLWRGRIPCGRLTLLVGRPGEGKSFATADWAGRITTGRAWPDGDPCELGSVLLIAGEDDPADTIRPRLDVHGADANRVRLLKGVHRFGPGGVPIEAMFTLEDVRPLELALAEIPDCRLVVVDPIGSFIGGKVDAHRDNEVRAVLAPLAALAQRSGAAVVIVAHQRKGMASHADDMVLGSRAFTGIARSVLHLMRDPDDDTRRLLLPGKMNLSAPADGLAFRIEGEPARLRWEDGTVSHTADDVLGAGGDSGRTEREGAAEWLRAYLADGPKLARTVYADAAAAGFSKRTIDRAKPLAGVKTTKEAFSGGWVWSISTGEDCQGAKCGNLGNF